MTEPQKKPQPKKTQAKKPNLAKEALANLKRRAEGGESYRRIVRSILELDVDAI